MILSAYLLLTMGKVTGQSVAYQMMNVFGAAGFIVNGWYYGAIPSATLNVIWMMIGLVSLWQIRRRRAAPSRLP